MTIKSTMATSNGNAPSYLLYHLVCNLPNLRTATRLGADTRSAFDDSPAPYPWMLQASVTLQRSTTNPTQHHNHPRFVFEFPTPTRLVRDEAPTTTTRLAIHRRLNQPTKLQSDGAVQLHNYPAQPNTRGGLCNLQTTTRRGAGNANTFGHSPATHPWQLEGCGAAQLHICPAQFPKSPRLRMTPKLRALRRGAGE